MSPDSVLFFDLDGTLVDTDYANFLAYQHAVREVTKDQLDICFEERRRYNRQVLHASLPLLSDSDLARIVELKVQVYQQFLPKTKLNTALSEILHCLSQTHKTVLVTGCEENRASQTLRHHGLISLFHHKFFRNTSPDELSLSKYARALKEGHASPKSVIAFENEAAEIDLATLAGIPRENIISVSIAS